MSSLRCRLTPDQRPGVAWFESEVKYQLQETEDGYYPRTGARKDGQIFNVFWLLKMSNLAVDSVASKQLGKCDEPSQRITY